MTISVTEYTFDVEARRQITRISKSGRISEHTFHV